MKIISNQINPHFSLWDACVSASKIFGWSHPNFDQELSTKNYRMTNTGRSALGIIAEIVAPEKNKKIGIPAFVCGVVATPFLQKGYQIEWIETDENGLIDPQDFSIKAANIGLIVVPHIFGQAAPLSEINKIAKMHDIFVVEDGAHRLSTDTTQCDAKILSFGREKVISCVSGGALLWPEDSPYARKFKQYDLPAPSIAWQIRHALQPIIFAIAQPWWHAGGKILPALMLRLKILPLAVTSAEKNGQEDISICRLGKIQKRILKRQWRKSPTRLKKARARSVDWSEFLPATIKTIIPDNAFRVIAVFKNPDEKEKILKKFFNHKTWHLRDWDGQPISPNSVNLEKFGYQLGMCPKAEQFAQTHLTLPTNIYCQAKDIKGLEKSA